MRPFNKKNFFAHHKRYGKILKPELVSKRPAVDYKDYKQFNSLKVVQLN